MRAARNARRPRPARAATLAAVALAAVTAPLLTGCAYGAAVVTDDGRAYPPTAPAEVRLHPGRDPGFPYAVIGPVAAFTMGEASDAMRELAVQAAGVGADAVIDVRLSKLSKNTGASGIAVKRAPPPQGPPPAAAPPAAVPVPTPVPAVAPAPPAPLPPPPAPPAPDDE